MSLFTNLLLLFVCLAVLFFAFGVETPAATMLSGSAELYNSSSGMVLNLFPLEGGVIAIGAVFGGIALAVGSAGIPIVIGALLMVSLIPLFTFPIGLLNTSGMPPVIQGLLVTLFIALQLLFIVSMINNLRGMSD